MTIVSYYTRHELEGIEDEYYLKLEHGAQNRCWHDYDCNCGGITADVMSRWIRTVNRLTGELARMEAENSDVTENPEILQLLDTL